MDASWLLSTTTGGIADLECVQALQRSHHGLLQDWLAVGAQVLLGENEAVCMLAAQAWTQDHVDRAQQAVPVLVRAHLLLAAVMQTLPNNHVDALACQIHALCEVCDASICQAITFELFGLVTLMHFQLQTQLMDMLTFLTYLMHENLCWKLSDNIDRYFILLYLISNCTGTGSVCTHQMLATRGKLVPRPQLSNPASCWKGLAAQHLPCIGPQNCGVQKRLNTGQVCGQQPVSMKLGMATAACYVACLFLPLMPRSRGRHIATAQSISMPVVL
jgi:hypothetical protein